MYPSRIHAFYNFNLYDLLNRIDFFQNNICFVNSGS